MDGLDVFYAIQPRNRPFHSPHKACTVCNACIRTVQLVSNSWTSFYVSYKSSKTANTHWTVGISSILALIPPGSIQKKTGKI